MHFPLEDVEANVRHFIASVKRATGNAKDPAAKDRKLKSAGGARPGELDTLYLHSFSIDAVCSDTYPQGNPELSTRSRDSDS